MRKLALALAATGLIALGNMSAPASASVETHEAKAEAAISALDDPDGIWHAILLACDGSHDVAGLPRCDAGTRVAPSSESAPPR